MRDEIERLKAEVDGLRREIEERDGLDEEWGEELVEKLRRERDSAERCCAEMRDAMECDDDDVETWNHALSSDCGKGYHHDDEWKPVVEALSNCLEHVKILLDIDGRPMDMNDRDIISQAEQALAHAERLMKGEK